MSNHQFPPQKDFIIPRQSLAESDEDFIDRQFRKSIKALERVHALSPGEFDRLIQGSITTDEERLLRSKHHEDIARRALIAAQENLICEEEFNIWSSRRKEEGQPVKFRFERAFANTRNTYTTCRRGALTGIVRAYLRLEEELTENLICRGESAESAQELFEVEKEAVKSGFLTFEHYFSDELTGWPCFPRSTGRFRGSVRLRQFFEQRQSELPMPQEFAEKLKKELGVGNYRFNRGSSKRSPSADDSDSPLFQRLVANIGRLFAKE